MKKRITALVLTVVMAFGLVACGSKDAWKVEGMKEVVKNMGDQDTFNTTVSKKNEEFFAKKANLFPSDEKKHEKLIDDKLTTEKVVKDVDANAEKLYTFEMKVLNATTEDAVSADDKKKADGEKITVIFGAVDDYMTVVVLFGDNTEDIKAEDTIEVTGLPYVILESKQEIPFFNAKMPMVIAAEVSKGGETEDKKDDKDTKDKKDSKEEKETNSTEETK